MRARCFMRPFDPEVGCDGRMDRAHLIAQQVVKREVSRDRTVVWDERIWRPVCRAHHHRLDMRLSRLPRRAVPVSVEEFAVEHGIGWWLDRTYGTKETDHE